MRSAFFMLSAVVALSGCASGGQASPEDDTDRITIVVVNEFERRVTAFAVWPSGRPRRLGEVSSMQSRTFETVRMGNSIAIGLEVMSAPPAGTTAGPTGFQGGAPPRINPGMVTSESLLIGPGEGIEWQLGSTGSLAYRYIVPE